jgi:hypothetical protein
MLFSIISTQMSEADLRTAVTPQRQMVTPGVSQVFRFEPLFVNCHVNWTCHQHLIYSALKSMSFLENHVSTDATRNPGVNPLAAEFLWF